MEYRFVFIVIYLFIQNLIYLIYTSLNLPRDEVVGSGTFILLLVFCVLAVSRSRCTFRIGIVGGTLSAISVWSSIIFGVGYLGFIYVLFFLYTTAIIVYNVTASREINVNIIFGSIAGFLLIGTTGAMACSILEFYVPGSFAMASDMGPSILTFYYFSFITMTSLGYGDITPATDIARVISVYLVVLGQLYLAIQVAILVGKFIGRSSSRGGDRELEGLKRELTLLKAYNAEDDRQSNGQ